MTSLSNLKMPSEIVLSEDQELAEQKFVSFLLDPEQVVFVLEGYSGTGKTTLVRTLIDRLPKYIAMAELISQDYKPHELQLTATTNKAAEAFAQITGMHVITIHSFLGLRVDKDFRTGITRLIPKSQEPEEGYLLFIDEASYIDSALLDLIFKKTKNCKIVLMGDRAQLAAVKSSTTPAFHAGFNGAMLTEVMRQAEGNPIIEMATMFRNVVNGEPWGRIKIDGEVIRHLPRDRFEAEILVEFNRPDWHFSDSKVLGWTNACVIAYNNAISEHVTGDPNFQVGDYAVCNNFVSQGKQSLKTDQLVHITDIGPDEEEYGVLGNMVTLDYTCRFFFPKSLAAKKERIKQAKINDEYTVGDNIDRSWIDLRAVYAQTINKSQGSTYNEVFIDLDDLRKCTNGNSLARLMYVGVSRARTRVTFTGDLA